LGRSAGTLVGCVLLLMTSPASGQTRVSPCYAGFEVSQACITERGLDKKQAAYKRKIAEAMSRLGASYKIALRLVNHPVAAGYDATVGDVFTEVVRNEEMRNQSFIINVTASFLEQQPETLFEASALHEVCHVMNDDLSGYHRNGGNTEVAEERCVLEVAGESRYEQYLQAYAAYRRWDRLTYEWFLKRVKDVDLAPAPRESDEADRLALQYFRLHADGGERVLVYNGELHDVTLRVAKGDVGHDSERMDAIVKARKPMIVFHNHPAGGGRAAMFPSSDDFGVAALVSFMAYAEDPTLPVDFRIVQLGEEEDIVVSYGFKGTVLEDIREIAREYSNAAARQVQILSSRLAREVFSDYLQYVCPVDKAGTDGEACRTHPEYFLWPSDRFFVHHRPQ
jgi:hypothetical protein